MDLNAEVPELLLRDPAITSVQLAGSRERGDPNPLSDWDFVIETDDAGHVRENISHLLDPLGPLVAQWDRLGPVWCYMLILKGGVKVDVIVEGSTRVDEAPWDVLAETLPAIEGHFWDWTLWLGSKSLKHDSNLVAHELAKMFDHLLEPLGVRQGPKSLGESDIGVHRRARSPRARARRQDRRGPAAGGCRSITSMRPGCLGARVATPPSAEASCSIPNRTRSNNPTWLRAARGSSSTSGRRRGVTPKVRN